MKAYVTGGTGFIGSHLVEHLVNQGYHVTCLIRKTSNLHWLDHLLAAQSPQVQIVTGNLHDTNILAQHVRDADLVFHLAGLTKAPDAATYDRVNAEGTKHLIEACLGAQTNLNRFVLLQQPRCSRSKLRCNTKHRRRYPTTTDGLR